MADEKIRSQEWVDKIEELVRRAEALPDPNARRVSVELLRAVLAFHAAGLERILDTIFESGATGEQIIDKLAADDLTSSLLLLHDLHPDDLETRLSRAIDKLQTIFFSLGARLSLAGREGDLIRLRFESQRAWSVTAVKASVENAIFQAAPEITSVVLEGVKEAPDPGFVPVSDLLAGIRV
jgi:hypothetical protein